jgi:TatD DNase family protein
VFKRTFPPASLIFFEATLRLDTIKEISKKIKEAGGKVRLNTNGHGNVINKRNILPELKGLVDSISISLNADTAETYDQIVRPLPGLRNGIYDKVQEFIKEAKKYIPEVQATIVTKQEGVDEEKCEEISKNFFDIKYRPRRYNITG